MTPELIAQLSEWRAKAQAGKITVPELRAALEALRNGRQAASVTSTKSRTKSGEARAAKKPIDSDDLLSELD